MVEELKIEFKSVLVLSEEEMNFLYVELNNCKLKFIVFSLVSVFVESFVLKIRKILIVRIFVGFLEKEIEFFEE